MASPNIAYDIRFNGTHYEVVRTRTYLTLAPKVEVVADATTREQAEEQVAFHQSLDDDAARDRAGR